LFSLRTSRCMLADAEGNVIRALASNHIHALLWRTSPDGRGNPKPHDAEAGSQATRGHGVLRVSKSLLTKA
jgi:hypothetical protein